MLLSVSDIKVMLEYELGKWEIFLISNWITLDCRLFSWTAGSVGTVRYIIFVWAVIEKHKKRIRGLTRISVDPHHLLTRNKKLFPQLTYS